MLKSPDDKTKNSKFSHASFAVPNLLGFLVFIAIGIIITGQVISGIRVHAKESEIREKIEILIEQKTELIVDNNVLEENNKELKEMSLGLSDAFLTSYGNSELRDSYLVAMKVAGLTEISGSGIEIKLYDSSSGLNPETIEADIIHSQDVRYIIDLLVNSGATAIDINGERIVNTTNILCAGPTIRINDRRYPAPFVIHAICDPVSTYDILFNDSRIIDRMAENVVIDISKQDFLVIPAFTDSDRYLILDTELEVNPEK
jgi:uncharacterized protein YlxW (UPF0749 family)